MILHLLALWYRLTNAATNVWNAGISYLRTCIGPAPASYYLLNDGRVIPASIALPQSLTSTTYLYNPHTNRLTHLEHLNHDGRHRRLPIIAASFEHESTSLIDISEWIGEIRAHPTPEVNIKQLLTLWSLVHNRYVPLSDGVNISVTKNDG